MTRKKTPDIMGGLLSGRKTAQQQDSKTVHKQQDSLTAEKKQATLYFSQEATDALERARYTLRQLAYPEQRSAITKSSIVEAAFLLALEDLEKNGAESQLAKRLV
jgi:hypothetical protein